MFEEKVAPANSDNLNELFSRYWQTAQRSPVTSSYWEKQAPFSSVKKEGDGFIVNGNGFGHFVRPGSLKHVKHFIKSVSSRQLLSRFGVSEEIKAAGHEISRKQKRLLILDEVKQIIICDILKKHDILKQSKAITVIGDGYGFMSCLLRLAAPHAKIIDVNLGKILFFDMLYASKVFPDTKMFLLQDKDDYEKALEQNPMIFVEAENYEMLLGNNADLFINIASMQEMNMDVIKKYFDIIRSSTGKRYFYSCNRVEKVLPDGSIIRFDEFPWDLNKDEIIIDELCPFYQQYPISVPPFWLPLEGPVKHRLAKLNQVLC